MSDDIVNDLLARLRLAQIDHNAWRWGWAAESADAITALQARVEKLEGAEEDRDEYQRQAKLYAERCAESDIELAAARALLVRALEVGLIGEDGDHLATVIDAALAAPESSP